MCDWVRALIAVQHIADSCETLGECLQWMCTMEYNLSFLGKQEREKKDQTENIIMPLYKSVVLTYPE